MDRNTGCAQYGLHNAGELVRIDPSLGMAEFISNSAIRRTIQPQLRAYAGDRTRPKVRKMADFAVKSAIRPRHHIAHLERF